MSISSILDPALFDWCSFVLAQQASPSSYSWLQFFEHLDNGKLVLILIFGGIFGSGIIYALGSMISSVIRAVNGSSDQSEEQAIRLDELDRRIEELEKAQATYAEQVKTGTW